MKTKEYPAVAMRHQGIMPDVFQVAVRRFNIAAGQRVRTEPGLPEPEDVDLYASLLREEFGEFNEAIATGNLPQIAKEGADLLYVLLGLMNGYGIHFAEIFAAVHQNNLTKLSGGKLRKDENGKLLKPEGYKPLDVVPLLVSQGWRRDEDETDRG